MFAGNLAEQAQHAAQIHVRIQAIADALKALNAEANIRFGFFSEAANSTGGYVAGALPGAGGMDAGGMIANPRKAYVVLHAEMALDSAYGAQAVKALAGAELSVVLTPFRHSLDCADVLLPIAPFTERDSLDLYRRLCTCSAFLFPDLFRKDWAPACRTHPSI